MSPAAPAATGRPSTAAAAARGRLGVALALVLSSAACRGNDGAAPPAAAVAASDEAASGTSSRAPAGGGGTAPADPDRPDAPVAAAAATTAAASGGAAAATGTSEVPAATAGTSSGAPDRAADTGPRRVLILGDSLAATGFGALLERRLDEDPRIVAYRKGKSASGLSRPDFFDWVDAARRQIEFRHPELVVVILGGNDGQDLVPARWHKKRVRWDTPAWQAGYRERVDALLDVLVGPDRRVLWLGLPPTQTVKFERKLALIRRIQREAVEARAPAATYLDLAPLLQDEGGALARSVQHRGKTLPMRAKDGIHFTMEGSRFLADKVAPKVVAALGLPSGDAVPSE